MQILSLLESGTNSFLFEVDPFSKGDWYAAKQKGTHLSCLPCKTSEYTLTLLGNSFLSQISFHYRKCYGNTLKL